LAVRIRLKRAGSRHRPFYKIIVADSRSARDGADIESLGYYDPLKHPEDIKVDEDRYNHWLSVGASASESVETLFRRLKRRAAGEPEPEPEPVKLPATDEAEAKTKVEEEGTAGSGTGAEATEKTEGSEASGENKAQ
jgi:small subunit ribosomal protein S16